MQDSHAHLIQLKSQKPALTIRIIKWSVFSTDLKILQVVSTLKLVRFPTKCSPEIKGFMKYTTHKICILADNEIPVKSITQRNCIK